MAQDIKVSININEEKNGIELTFSSKPDQEVLDRLKEMNFRWHNQRKMWFAKQTSERIEFANGLKNELDPKLLSEDIEEEDITQEDIDAVIMRGSGVFHGKLRIYEQFEKKCPSKENVEFLKEEYGMGGAYPAIPNTNISEDHSAKGIRIQKRTLNKQYDEQLVKWPEVEKRVKELILQDRYLNEKEKDEYPKYLYENEKKRKRAVISEKFRDLISEFNEMMTDSGTPNKQLNRYVLSDCASQFVQGNKTTYTLLKGNDIIPLMRNAMNTIMQEDSELVDRCKEVLDLLDGDLAKEIEGNTLAEKTSDIKEKNKANTFANSYKCIDNDPILEDSNIAVFNTKGNGCYLRDLNIYFKRYNGYDSIVITELENSGQKGKECRVWTVQGNDLYSDLQEEGIETIKELYETLDSRKEIESVTVHDHFNKGIDVFSPFVETAPLSKLPEKWNKTNFINALRSGQLFYGEIDSRYTDDYRNDYASNNNSGLRIDMSSAAKKELASWDKLTSAVSGEPNAAGIVPVIVYAGNITKTYFFDINCNIAEGKERCTELKNAVERYNRMMEHACIELSGEEIAPEKIYRLKILFKDVNTGRYIAKDEVLQGYLFAEKLKNGDVSVLSLNEYPVIDNKIYSVTNFYDRPYSAFGDDNRMIYLGNWENVVTGKALKELTKEQIFLPCIRTGPFDGDYEKLRNQLKERERTGSNFSVSPANYGLSLNRLESEYERSAKAPTCTLENLIKNAEVNNARTNIPTENFIGQDVEERSRDI